MTPNGTLIEWVWVLWLLALVPFKARNLYDAWSDLRIIRRVPPALRDPGAVTVAEGTWRMDVSIAVILFAFLSIGLLAVFAIPSSPQREVRLAQAAVSGLFLLAAVGLTAAIGFQYQLRRKWRQSEPSIPKEEARP